MEAQHVPLGQEAIARGGRLTKRYWCQIRRAYGSERWSVPGYKVIFPLPASGAGVWMIIVHEALGDEISRRTCFEFFRV